MKKVKNAPYVREDDNFMTALCLYMTAVFSKPVPVWDSVLTVFAVIIGMILLMVWVNSLLPFWVALGMAVAISILASIGAAIRKKRM